MIAKTTAAAEWGGVVADEEQGLGILVNGEANRAIAGKFRTPERLFLVLMGRPLLNKKRFFHVFFVGDPLPRRRPAKNGRIFSTRREVYSSGCQRAYTVLLYIIPKRGQFARNFFGPPAKRSE
jgi:hypothetical protein